MQTNNEPENTEDILGIPSNPALARFFDEHSALVADLGQFDLAQLASFVGGLLTHPEWQASSLRLDVLQHLAVATAGGQKIPTSTELKSWLVELGEGLSGELEDPSEDVFVSRVILQNRDCLTFEGTYEAPSYYLQRFMDILEAMPRREPYAQVHRAAHHLLTLSDVVATRAGIAAYTVGQVSPLRSVPSTLLDDLSELGRRVVFTQADLNNLNIDPADLNEFVLAPDDCDRIRHGHLGDSTLHRFPLLLIDNCYYLALPTAVSMAIRRSVIELCISVGVEQALYRAYTTVISDSFEGVPLLGGISAPSIPFRERDDTYVANLIQYVDEGRALHVCFLVDDFQNHAETGTIFLGGEASRFAALINDSLSQAHRDLAHHPDFKSGISVIVGCPWGRPMAIGFNGIEDDRWRVVAITAADLVTISWLPKFSPLDLWRVLDERDRLKNMNIELINPSGFLNLYAWLESLEIHLRSDQLPENWDPDQEYQPLHILIPQNGLLRVRKETADAWNLHHAMTWDGRTVRVRRDEPRSFSPESCSPALYVDTDDLRARKFISVFETERRGWWTAVETPNSSTPAMHYRLWHACGVWIGKAASVLERALPTLPAGPIAWICRFEDSDEKNVETETPDRPKAASLLTVDVHRNVIHVTARQGFLASLRTATNMAESLLVEALVIGALRLSAAEASTHRVEELAKQIIPDQWARAIHLFEAQEFRQMVHVFGIRDPILALQMDDAYSRLGLGWRVRKRSEGAEIVGVAACCAYLNQVIDTLWNDIRHKLKCYRRESLLMQLVENHESIMAETDRWLKTARALMSLYSDEGETARETAIRMSNLNAGVLATRVLMEMAICECPESRGEAAGRLDIARLLASVTFLQTLGGWSESIRYGSQKAEIRLSPLGNINTSSDFDTQIAMPYGAALNIRRFLNGANDYEKYFQSLEIVDSIRFAFDPEFWEAWNEAFEFTIDELRVFMDNLDDEGVRAKAFAYILDFEGVCGLSGTSRLRPEIVKKILDALSLFSRNEWSSTPPGFSPRDWYPWRFRRRLSVISRPILQINADGSLRYLIAPAMVRDGIRKVLDYCVHGGYDAKDFPPGRMRSWIGSAENRRGHEFNAQVSERLRELGWQTRTNVTMTQILNAKLDRNYGDVDVIAWRAGRVLAIECKDLELARTVSEISRQLHDFRGETRDGKVDRLKKHLVRVEILKAHTIEVRRFIRSETPVQIEPWLVFSDLVPMHFSAITSEHQVRLSTFDRLSEL